MPQFWRWNSSLFHNSVSPTKSPATPMSPNCSSNQPSEIQTPSPMPKLPPSATSTPTTTRLPHPQAPVTPLSMSTKDTSKTQSNVTDVSASPPTQHNPNELKVVLTNCEGVTGKSLVIENMLSSLEPDIFLAVESKLDKDVLDAEFLPPNYRVTPPFRKDRIRGGGGIFIAVRENLIVEALPDMDSNCEITWVKVRLTTNKFVIFGVFYTPTSDMPSLLELQSSLVKVRQRFPDTPLFLGGDFNLSGINWETLTHIPKTAKKTQCEFLLQLAADFHLEQLNFEPTRKKNILELMFSSCPELVTSCTTGPGISDHDHLVITKISLKPQHQIKKKRQIHLYKKADWIEIKKHLKNTCQEFQNKAGERSSSECWCILRDSILESIQKFVPQKTISGRHRQPWITRELKCQINRKKRIYKKAKKTGDDADWQKFRDLRKKSQKDIKKSHAAYLNTLISEDSQKGMFRYIKNKKKGSSGVGTLMANGKTAVSPKEKADMLNEQFVSVFTRDEPASVPPDLGPSPFQEMAKIEISENGVAALLKNLDAKKASGADNIPAIFLQHCALEIAPMLTTIIQKSLDTHDVPEDWKKAAVSPVYKAIDPNLKTIAPYR